MFLRELADILVAGGYTTIGAVGVFAILVVVWFRSQSRMDPEEPPLLAPRIPVIGHILGIFTGKMEYMGRIGLQNPDLPCLTAPLGTSKMYFVTSPQLIQAVYRNKSFSFDPLTMAFAERMIGFGPALGNLMRNPPTDGSISWLNDQHKRYDSLALGPALYAMNVRVLESLAGVLNGTGTDVEDTRLYLWVRDHFTVATVGALFGHDNPLTRDPELTKDLWDFETGQEQLVTQPFPAITARKAYQARGRLQKALRVYFRNGCHENSDVSMIIKQRAETNKKWGLSIDDIADHELGMLFVAVTNAIPTMFWMIVYIFRDPQLVADLREELEKVVTVDDDSTEGSDSRRTGTLDIGAFATACPLLNSAYREVMRLTNRQMASRVPLQDVRLRYTPTDGQGDQREYLFKKDVPLFMPSMTSNFLESVWGEDANQFNARRFMAKSRAEEKLQNQAANPFGGGKHLCPGRHFAYAEILGTVAALLLGFTIRTPSGGRVPVPPLNNNLAEAVAKPLAADQESILVRIEKRAGWEDVKWAFTTKGGQ